MSSILKLNSKHCQLIIKTSYHPSLREAIVIKVEFYYLTVAGVGTYISCNVKFDLISSIYFDSCFMDKKSPGDTLFTPDGEVQKLHLCNNIIYKVKSIFFSVI